MADSRLQRRLAENAKASKMREEAKISAEQQKRLDYAQELLIRAEELIKL